MKVVTISMEKGGVGKTVTTVNLAAALGLEGQRVLVIDLDSQGHATEWLGTKKQTVPSDASAYAVLTRRADIASTIRPTEEPGVMLCPAHELLARAATELGANLEGLFALKDAIDTAKQADLPIDVILIDNPPAKTPVVFNALMGADLIIAPVLSHGMSLEGLADLYDTVRRIRDRFRLPLPDPRVLINDYTGQSAADRQIRDYLYEQYAEQVFQTIIGRDAPLRECFVEAQSIFRYRRSARSASQFHALAQETRELLA